MIKNIAGEKKVIRNGGVAQIGIKVRRVYISILFNDNTLFAEKVSSRYGNEHWSEMPIGLGRRYKHDEWYHDRESQESPWEDDYSNEQDESHSPHYSGVKTLPGWKRPSSASEMDKKGVEVKFRQNVLSLVTGTTSIEK